MTEDGAHLPHRYIAFTWPRDWVPTELARAVDESEGYESLSPALHPEQEAQVGGAGAVRPARAHGADGTYGPLTKEEAERERVLANMPYIGSTMKAYF